MQRFNYPAIVLRTHPLGEADLIVTLLARDAGKLRAVARNARTSKKRFPGGIDLFDCGVAELEQGRSRELLRLHGLSKKLSWSGIRTELGKLAAASYAVELTDLLIMEEAQEGSALFELLFHTLQRIDRAQTNHQLRSFLAFYTLAMGVRGGFGSPVQHLYEDSLDERPQPEEVREGAQPQDEISEWFSAMEEQGAAIIPHAERTSRDTLPLLLRFAEETAGKPLKSATPVLQALAD